MKEVSILIPVYNDNVVSQVDLLRSQCAAIPELLWEIIVSDDGSSEDYIKVNTPVSQLPNCRIVFRHNNFGRSSNRNFLAHEAKYDTLLYIDSGLKPNPHYVEKYVENIGKSLVVCGNIEVDKECIDLTNLRCKNELKAQKRFTASRHTLEPYKNFHSGSFMIDRLTMLANPMREDIKTYGYEDTLFGKMLYERHIGILHIDNPVLFVRFESNERFLEKTREGINTLYNYREELYGYSPLLYLVNKLRGWHLLWIVQLVYKCLGKLMERNLKGNNPSLKVFGLYRVCLFAELIG